jgi:hypothetical protein
LVNAARFHYFENGRRPTGVSRQNLPPPFVGF